MLLVATKYKQWQKNLSIEFVSTNTIGLSVFDITLRLVAARCIIAAFMNHSRIQSVFSSLKVVRYQFKPSGVCRSGALLEYPLIYSLWYILQVTTIWLVKISWKASELGLLCGLSEEYGIRVGFINLHLTVLVHVAECDRARNLTTNNDETLFWEIVL